MNCRGDGTKAVLFSLLLTFIVINLFGPFSINADFFQFDVEVGFLGSGKTVLHFPPLGKAVADTHLPPLDFHFSLVNIDLDKATEAAADVSGPQLWDNVVQQAGNYLIMYVLFLLMLAFALGAAGYVLWMRRNAALKDIVISGAVSLLVLLLLLAAAAVSYDMAAFSEAEYVGIIEAAPMVLDVLGEGMGVIEDIGVQFVEIAENITLLREGLKDNIDFEKGEDTVRILHVSDIHNNPTAFQFIEKVAGIYKIDAIIDTGDLVDYGTALEMEFLGNAASFPVPYLFIPGNHESPVVVEHLKAVENVIVLENGVVEVAGLSIAGIADPSSFSSRMSVADEEIMEEAALTLREIVKSAGEVDIVAAHNPSLFKYLREEGHLLLGGHLHNPYVVKGAGFIEINAGSTGGSGIRGLQNLEADYSLVLLTFRRENKDCRYRPAGADLIRVKHFPFNFSFERFFFN